MGLPGGCWRGNKTFCGGCKPSRGGAPPPIFSSVLINLSILVRKGRDIFYFTLVTCLPPWQTGCADSDSLMWHGSIQGSRADHVVSHLVFFLFFPTRDVLAVFSFASIFAPTFRPQLRLMSCL